MDAPGERGPALGSSPASCPCASISPGESLGRELGLLRSWAALEVGSEQTWGCQAPPTSSMREEGGGSARFLDKENWGKSRQKGSRVAHRGVSPPGTDCRAPCPPLPDLRGALRGAVAQSLSHVWVGSRRAVTGAAWTDVDKAVSWAVSPAPRVGQFARPRLWAAPLPGTPKQGHTGREESRVLSLLTFETRMGACLGDLRGRV